MLRLTLQEVLEDAVHKEMASRFLYIGLRQTVKNEAARSAFQSLAEQEELHQRIIENYMKGKYKQGALSTGMVVDYKITETLNEPEITPTMDLKDIFALAAKKEKSAFDLYRNLAEMHPPGEVRDLLMQLSEQEMEHKHRLETIYTEVAFPQTDGG